MGRALSGADRCSVWVVSEDKKTIWTKVSHGIEGIELPINSGIVGDAITNGHRVIIDDVYQDERFNPEIDKKTGYRTKSMMVIPMYDYDENVIGAFQVINHIGSRGIFDKRDMERLTLASTYAAETIIAAQLENEIEETQKEVVYTMGSIAESRSKETGNHVRRVAAYSKILALAYGMGEQEAELLHQASPMHDIGKLAIPDAILNKPGRFDENEREIMNSHAELGYHMIKNSDRPLLKAAAIVAYEHHEKWDGTGYPRGLKEKEIHIYGRITAVADVFDALASDRVYKKAWEDGRIFKLLKEEKGKHFDPELIDLFFEHLDEVLQVREKFKDIFVEEKKIVDNRNKITVLGAYGTKSKGHGTTSFLLNNKNVIDAGNLLETLDTSSADIEYIWLTHSHLDHIVDIAYILDNYFGLRKKTLHIMALPQTIKAVKENFLNDIIWPDFTKIKLLNSQKIAVQYIEIELGKSYSIAENEYIEAFETDHTIASCGYIYTKKGKAVMITADTCSLDTPLSILNERKEINSLVVECSFPNHLEDLAIESKHLTPKLLFTQLEKLKRKDISLYINHIKPSFIKKITDEIAQNRGEWDPKILKDKEIIYFS